MNSVITYLGSFYVLIGTLFLFVPLIYLELGRPKDLIKAFLNFLIGLLLIIKNKAIDETLFIIFFLLTSLVALYVLDLFLYRWNQLTDKEKNKLTTYLEFKNNFSKILEAITLGADNCSKLFNFSKFISKNKKITPKKWVRNDKNDTIKN